MRVFKHQNERYDRLLSQKKKSEVVTGQVAETMAPFLVAMKDYNPKNLKFIGMPIDFISFEDDAVYFIEVKSANAVLSAKQRKIKRLVDEGKIYFRQIQIN